MSVSTTLKIHLVTLIIALVIGGAAIVKVISEEHQIQVSRQASATRTCLLLRTVLYAEIPAKDILDAAQIIHSTPLSDCSQYGVDARNSK